VLAFSAFQWAVFFVAVRRGAPLNGPGAGAYAGAAAFLFAAAVAGARWLERWDHA